MGYRCPAQLFTPDAFDFKSHHAALFALGTWNRLAYEGVPLIGRIFKGALAILVANDRQWARQRAESSHITIQRKTIIRTIVAALRSIIRIQKKSSLFLAFAKKWLKLSIRQKRTSITAGLWIISDVARSRIVSANRVFIDEPEVVLNLEVFVSVIMPVYNQTDELIRAINSVLAQSVMNWELIIWNDGSTNPTTLQILDDLERKIAKETSESDSKIHIFHALNRGVVGARNSAISKSRGRYLCFLDPDDYIAPTYFEKAILKLECHVQYDLIVPNVKLLGHPEAHIWVPEVPRWPTITFYNSVPIASIVSADAVEAIGWFDNDFKIGWEDWDLWIRFIASGCKGVALREGLFTYTVSQDGRENSVSAKNSQELRELLDRKIPKPPKTKLKSEVLASVSKVINGLSKNFGDPELQTVIFFVPRFTIHGGAEVFLRSLAHELSRYQFNIIFIATENKYPQVGDGIESFFEITPYVYRLTDFLAEQDFDLFINDLINKSNRPIIVNVGSHLLYKWIEALNFEKYSDGVIVDILFNPIGHFPRHSELKESFDDVVFVYQELLEIAIKSHSIASRASVIPVGILSAGNGTKQKSRTDQIVVGWLGRLSEEKRPEWFIKIAHAMKGKAQFRLVGTGILENSCKSRSINNDSLTCEGFIAETDRFFSEIDLLVNTSSIEGISVTAMEALSAGVPVICTAVGGMAELVRDGINGVLCNPNSPREIKLAVKRFIEDSDYREKLINGARNLGLEKEFNQDEMVNHYVELFASGIQRKFYEDDFK